jgi:tyrosyl-tRNA synthetase
LACSLQVGGSDQWGNITAGIDLIRKLRGKTAYGITFPLITTASGQKFGKTEAGTIWLDPERTSPYDFYQYFIRTDDRDVIKFLNYFTFISDNEIKELGKIMKEKPEAREAQKQLAFEVTAIVHGKDAAIKARADSEKMFSKKRAELDPAQLDQSLTTNLPQSELDKGLSLVDALVKCGLSKSKGEARRLISQGGVYVNDQRVSDVNYLLSKEECRSDAIVLRAGKKNYRVLVLEP